MACAGLRDLVMLTKQLDTFGAEDGPVQLRPDQVWLGDMDIPRFADGTSPFSRFGLLFHHKLREINRHQYYARPPPLGE